MSNSEIFEKIQRLSTFPPDIVKTVIFEKVTIGIVSKEVFINFNNKIKKSLSDIRGGYLHLAFAENSFLGDRKESFLNMYESYLDVDLY